MTRAALGLVLLAGCAQLLGLDSTKPPVDASVDAPSVCDGLPACTGSGRLLCGQLVQTGSAAGAPLRVAAPTGAVCAGSATSGPCALTVTGGSLDQLVAGSGAVSGTIDDCGRYTVDLDPALATVAAIFDGPGFARTGRALADRPAQPGSDVATALVVTAQTQAAWAAQLAGSGSAQVDTTTGFLVLYTTVGDAPLAGEQAAADGSSPFGQTFDAMPWAAFFSGAFDTLDPTATHTSAAGTALVAPGAGSGTIEGFRTGKRCGVPHMQTLSSTLLFIVETGC